MTQLPRLLVVALLLCRSAKASDIPELGQEELGVLKFSDFNELDIHELLEGPETRLDVALLGDATLQATSLREGRGNTSFAIGQLGILANARLGASFHALGEVAMEVNDENELAIDLERLHLRWSSEHFFIMAGRVHAPFDYWNVAYHHGSWPQLTITRPRFLDFEDKGGVLPVHAVGIYAAAYTPVAGGLSTALVGVSNGRGSNPDDLLIVRDNNNAKSILVNLHHDFASRLRIGVAGIYDVIATEAADVRPALPDTDIRELIAAVHVVYMTRQWTIMLEGFDIEHHAAGRTWRTLAGFALLGYRLDLFTPYVRVEGLAARGGVDPFFTPDPSAAGAFRLSDYVEAIAGTRLDLGPNVALKLEYRAFLPRDAKMVSTGALNWSFAI